MNSQQDDDTLTEREPAAGALPIELDGTALRLGEVDATSIASAFAANVADISADTGHLDVQEDAARRLSANALSQTQALLNRLPKLPVALHSDRMHPHHDAPNETHTDGDRDGDDEDDGAETSIASSVLSVSHAPSSGAKDAVTGVEAVRTELMPLSTDSHLEPGPGPQPVNRPRRSSLSTLQDLPKDKALDLKGNNTLITGLTNHAALV